MYNCRAIHGVGISYLSKYGLTAVLGFLLYRKFREWTDHGCFRRNKRWSGAYYFLPTGPYGQYVDLLRFTLATPSWDFLVKYYHKKGALSIMSF